MSFDILTRRRTNFVLWAPGVSQAPTLLIGKLRVGNPITLTSQKRVPLERAATDLWQLPATSDKLSLEDGIYHYWFEVNDSRSGNKVLVTDPLSYCVDYRIVMHPEYQPASLIRLQGGQLLPCDPDSTDKIPTLAITPLEKLPKNNQLVIYELPASWTRAGISGSDGAERDVGSFLDVVALFEKDSAGGNFAGLDEIASSAHLTELGINCLELLPPADTKASREWGYATAHYFAPDYDLGFPETYTTAQPISELVNLVNVLHGRGVRFVTDNVMAFGHDPMIYVAYDSFHIDPSKADDEDPDKFQSSRNRERRDGYGGESWRYANRVKGYDPESGADPKEDVQPAGVLMRAQLARWMGEGGFGVDGVRLDSCNNIANWSFIKEFNVDGRKHFRARYGTPGGSVEVDSRFLVIAEELAVPLDMIRSGTVDALWNEGFQRLLRGAVLGRSANGENSFEWTVRKMVDCRGLGFTDGTQAINYITSHDTGGGPGKWRLYNFLTDAGLWWDIERRAKLAFVCLLTSVGVPMIFAGEEFADQQDRNVEESTGQQKQIDPVNWARKSDTWRTRIFETVSRLVKLRTSNPALSVNDTDWIHMDFDFGRRILAWKRGSATMKPVVVVANFSDAFTPGSEYRINGWPSTGAGSAWREVCQDRAVPGEWVGREPLFPWEAKVYECL